MPDDVARLPWTDEQWASVQRTVQEAACKARVASSFLPLVGPLPPGQASVPALSMGVNGRLEINDAVTLPLTTLSCEVHLTTQQVEDPDLASAKQLLGRAADLVGRLEDAIVFNGLTEEQAAAMGQQQIYRVQGVDSLGLLSLFDAIEVGPDGAGRYGSDLVTKVGTAIRTLEGQGHYGPFACVLGHDLFAAANTSQVGTLVMPRDRIVPFLGGGELMRSSVVPDGEGVVVSLAGSPIDLVIASDVHVKFLQVTLEPRYVLRVSERFVLRLKQPTARCRLMAVPPPKVDLPAEEQLSEKFARVFARLFEEDG